MMHASGDLEMVSGDLAGWDEHLQGFGKVVFRQKISKMMSAFGIAIVAAVVGLYLGYRSGESDTTTLLWVAVIAISFLLLVFAWPMLWNRKKTIAVEADGVRLTNNVVVPWSEIRDTGVWSYRGSEMVMLKVTDAFMREYQSRLSAASKILTRMNSALGGGDTLYLPAMLDADPNDLSEWISLLIQRRQANASSPYDDAFGGRSTQRS